MLETLLGAPEADASAGYVEALHTAIEPTRGKVQTPADVSGPNAMDLILQVMESCGMCIHQHAYTKAVETVAGSHFVAFRLGAHATARQYDVDSMQKFCRAVSVHDQDPGLGGQSVMGMLLKEHPGLREQFRGRSARWQLIILRCPPNTRSSEHGHTRTLRRPSGDRTEKSSKSSYLRIGKGAQYLVCNYAHLQHHLARSPP